VVPAILIATQGQRLVRVFTPAPGGGLSLPLTFTILPPVMSLLSVSPSSFAAGSGSVSLQLLGSGFTPAFVAMWDGLPLATTFVSANELAAIVPASFTEAPSVAALHVDDTASVATSSLDLPVDVAAPTLVAVTAVGNPVVAGPEVTGSWMLFGGPFVASATVLLDGMPAPTTFIDANHLSATLHISAAVLTPPHAAGYALSVQNSPGAQSNALALEFGNADNAGAIVRQPPVPAAGATFRWILDGGHAGAPVTFAGAAGSFDPATGVPLPGLNLVVGIDAAAAIPLVDGLGLFGATDGTLLTSPDPYAGIPGGRLVLPPLAMPQAPLGLTFTLQAAWVDPSAPLGFRLSWPKPGETL